MVSNASELFPEPLIPVTTTSRSRGSYVDVRQVVLARAAHDQLLVTHNR
jgi:hypothetical protein